MKSLALLIKAEQNSSLTFIAVHWPIPNVNPMVLYKFPVANLHRATATYVCTVIASRRIVFCRINWRPTRPQMCSNVSLLTLKCSRLRWSWYQFKTWEAVQTKTVVLDKPTLSCAYGDSGCFAAGLSGLKQSVVSSPYVETLVTSSERNVISFDEIWRESV